MLWPRILDPCRADRVLIIHRAFWKVLKKIRSLLLKRTV